MVSLKRRVWARQIWHFELREDGDGAVRAAAAPPGRHASCRDGQTAVWILHSKVDETLKGNRQEGDGGADTRDLRSGPSVVSVGADVEERRHHVSNPGPA